MLGVGLHSYGFMEQALFWLLAFIVSQVVLIGFGMLPDKYWASFAKSAANLPPPVPPSPSGPQEKAPASVTAKY